MTEIKNRTQDKTKSKRGRKPRGLQAKFRRETFSTHQYWNITYTERYSHGEEKDFRIFIRAKSYKSAKQILLLRLQEDDPKIKLKAVMGFMFHKDYKSDNGKRLGLKEWQQIRDAAFPNVSNTLFKLFLPRPEWKSNRFNATDVEHLKTIGFKTGDENWSKIHRKGKTLPIHEREGKIWVGHEWVEWDKGDMERTKNRIISALILHNNVRKKAAKELGIDRNPLYRIMSRVKGIDWSKEYPCEKNKPPRVPREQRSATQKRVMKERMAQGHVPFSHLTEEQKQKKYEAMCAAFKNKREKFTNEFVPKAKEALSLNNNSRKLAADHLGMKRPLFSKWLNKTKHIVNWSKEYPNSYIKNK